MIVFIMVITISSSLLTVLVYWNISLKKNINNHVKSMPKKHRKKETSIKKTHKLETNKHKQLIPFTETCQKPPRVLNHFFGHRWPEAQAEMMLFQRILGELDHRKPRLESNWWNLVVSTPLVGGLPYPMVFHGISMEYHGDIYGIWNMAYL